MSSGTGLVVGRFTLKLTICLVIALGLQLWILQKIQIGFDQAQIFVCYGLVYLLTVLSFLSLQIGQQKTVDRLGFVFLGRSLLKMMVCFVFCILLLRFRSVHRIAFFMSLVIPYSLSLIIEVVEMVKSVKTS